MRFASVCSGIEAASVAWLPLGWSCEFVAEIERFPSSLLKHRYPNTPNYGDITKFRDWPDHTIDVLIGGTPCQSFSVAGLRAGLRDPRGNLALTFLAIAERYRPRFVVWENVPGVHSSWSDEATHAPAQTLGDELEKVRRDFIAAGLDPSAVPSAGEFEEVDQSNDFDSFIAGLAELGYGVSYSILDAQFFHLAQRRERVFVVGCAGGHWQRAAAILSDRAGLRRDFAPRRQTGERTAPTLEAGVGRSGTPNDFHLSGGLAPTLPSRNSGGGGLGTDADLDGALVAETLRQHPRPGSNTTGAIIPIQEIGKRQSGTPMNGVWHGKPGDPMFTLQSGAQHGIVAPTLRAGGNKTGGDRPPGTDVDTCESLVPIGFGVKDSGQDAESNLSPTIRSGGHDKSHANGGVMPAVAWALQERDSKGSDSSTNLRLEIRRTGNRTVGSTPTPSAISTQKWRNMNETRRSEGVSGGASGGGEQRSGFAGLQQTRSTSNLRPQNRNDKMFADATTEPDVAERALKVIRALVNEMADEPRQVQIQKDVIGYDSANLVIRANATDYGAMLGAGQKHILAFKSICRVMAGDGNLLQVRLEELPGGQKKKRGYLPPDETWDKTRLEGVFQTVFEEIFNHETKVQITCKPGGATAVEVILGDSNRMETADWVQKMVSPVIAMILSRNRRFPAVLTIIRDQMLYEQVTGLEAIEHRTSANWKA